VSYSIPILEKSYAVINCVSKHEEGLTLSEIVKRLDEPKSTIFKILYTLENSLFWKRRMVNIFLAVC
jgi:DNA-binding IclR family transcriptional regulator